MSLPIHIGMIDRSGEQTGTLLHFPLVSAEILGEDVFVVNEVTYDLVKTPLILLTKLNLTRTIASVPLEQSGGVLPSAADAQREWATRFTYLDLVTNRKYSFTIPAPVDAIVQAGTDVVDLGQLLVAAFVTAWETVCVSPDGNNAEIIGARIIGRNS